VAEDEEATTTDTENAGELHAHPKDLQLLLARIEAERQHIRRELQMRQGKEEKGWRRSSLHLPTMGETDEGSVHEFQKMAALDQLSRCMAVQRLVPVSIETAYETVAAIADYPKWMPLVSSTQITNEDEDGHNISCRMAFGPRTGTLLDLMESHIAYRVRLLPPHVIGEDDLAPREARIVSRTVEEFSYGKRLIFDWRLVETVPGETDVRVDVFFQAKNGLYLPFWDSLQAAVSNLMLRKFQERAFSVAKAQL